MTIYYLLFKILLIIFTQCVQTLLLFEITTKYFSALP